MRPLQGELDGERQLRLTRGTRSWHESRRAGVEVLGTDIAQGMNRLRERVSLGGSGEEKQA